LLELIGILKNLALDIDEELPGVELPGVELPGVELPGVELPGVELPDVELPDVELPDVELPDVELHNKTGIFDIPENKLLDSGLLDSGFSGEELFNKIGILNNIAENKLPNKIEIIKNPVKFVDKKNMQICLSESNGPITDLIDYTKSSDNYLNVLLPKATFHYMCRYTGSAETTVSVGSSGSSLLDDYNKINNSKQIIKDTTNSDKVKLFYYGTDLDNPTQLQIYFNHDDYYNYITLDNTKNTGNLKTLSDVKFVYITNNTKQFLAINKLSMDMLNNSLQLNKVQAKLSTTNEQIIKTQSELAETRTKISDTQTQLDKVKAININLQAQIDALQKK
jgi:hypothetical protein